MAYSFILNGLKKALGEKCTLHGLHAVNGCYVIPPKCLFQQSFPPVVLPAIAILQQNSFPHTSLVQR